MNKRNRKSVLYTVTEFEKELAKEFWFMERNKDSVKGNVISNLYDAFGCECESGWHELIRGMCADIVSAYEKMCLPIDIRISEIRSVHGRLHVDYSLPKNSLARTNGDDMFISDGNSQLDKIINSVRLKSEHTCEKCGADGKMRYNDEDMLKNKVLCDNCNKVTNT